MRAALALLLFAGCAGARDFITGEPTFNRFSLEEEIELGQRETTLYVAAMEMGGAKGNPVGVYTDTVRTVALRILSVPENRARMPPFPWLFELVDDPTPNAISFPGGGIVVLTGLMKSGTVRDEDELALLVAHEIGHISARHVTESATYHSWERLGAVGRFFGRHLVELVSPDAKQLRADLERDRESYGHEHELEADLIGVEMMARAGYDPERAMMLWRRRSTEGSGRSSTHPSYARRIEELEQHLPVAQFVRARMITTPREELRTGWVWPTEPAASDENVPSAGPLLRGANVPTTYVRPPPELARIRATVVSEPDGSAPRADVEVAVAPAISDDRLPLTAVLYLESEVTREVVHATRLAEGAPLEQREMHMRVALPRVAPGAYRIRVRLIVGSIWAESDVAIEVAPEVAWRTRSS